MAPQSDRAKIVELLQTDIRVARFEYEAAKLQFDQIRAEVPSGIPHPDGTLRIQQVSRAFRTALRNYNVAMWRYSEFTLNGNLPADLPPEH